MKLEWTKRGATVAVVLGDDADRTTKGTIAIEDLGGEAIVQIEPLAFGANPFQETRNNVAGQFVFTVTRTFASQDLANAYLAAEYARIGEQGNLVWSRAAKLFTFTNAVLRAVRPAQIQGVKVIMRYTFNITTLVLT